jgi:hypothetical protein
MSFASWRQQPTTVAGFSTLLGTGLAWMSGTMSGPAALCTAAGGIAAMVFPDNTGAPAAAKEIVAGVEGIADAWRQELATNQAQNAATAQQAPGAPAAAIPAAPAAPAATNPVAGAVGAAIGILFLAASLTACASNGVAQTEVGLTSAEQLAMQYVTLPACPSATGALCSDPSITAKIKAADDVAYAAVKGLENGTVTAAAAQAAVASLLSVIPATKK